MPALNTSLRNVPITPNVSQNTASIISRKMGMPVYLPVSTLSSLTLRACSRLSPCFTTVAAHSFSIKV